MKTYVVTEKATGAEVYRYGAEAPVAWAGYEFETHDHTVEGEVPAQELPASAWFMYPGPFKDRLGMDGLAIEASTHPICIAAKGTLTGRLYIDLKNPKVAAMLDMLIATGQPTASPYFPGSGPMTAEKKATILANPAAPHEIFRGVLNG